MTRCSWLHLLVISAARALRLVFNHLRCPSLIAWLSVSSLVMFSSGRCHLSFTWTLHNELDQILCKFDGCWCSTCRRSCPLFFSVHYLICSVWFPWLHTRFSSRHILTLLFWLFYGFYFLSPHSSLHASLHSCLLSFPQNCTRPSEPPVLSIPFIGMIVIVALIWCWWEELAS